MALLPAFLLALFAAWSGTLHEGATAPGAFAGQVALLGFVAWVGREWRDPLHLGWPGLLLPWALGVAVAASTLASPVPRAGWVGALLLPAFLLLPGLVIRCWTGERRRELGILGITAVTGGVAVWSLADGWLAASPRAALPLGHHTLLAGWLVTLLPLALLPLWKRGPWRWAGAATGLLAVAAVVASGSLLGVAALAAQALGAALLCRRLRVWAAVAALALVATQGGRLARVVTGVDPSAAARQVYLAAGWEGLAARPLLGWGPGSVPWTAAQFLRPIPGVNPPGEMVGDLHSLPLHLAYELGWTGLLLAGAVILLFVTRRIREQRETEDPSLSLGGLLGLGGALICRLGMGSLAVTAWPVAMAVAAGAAGACLPSRGERTVTSGAWPLRFYAAAAFLALLPLALAHGHYDRARRALAPEVALDSLARAVRWDPSFPLYRARRAWLQRDLGRKDLSIPRQALQAAEDGPGVHALWLAAGVLGLEWREDWGQEALRRACALDPLGALPAFYLVMAAPEADEAPVLAARAFLSEPRLAAALFWDGRAPLREAALTHVRTWDGVDPGWREAFLREAALPGTSEGPLAWLSLTLDREPGLSLSLHAFRRSPWPAELAQIPLQRDLAEGLEQIPSAARLSTTSREAFSRDLCRTGEEGSP